jgi:hypothetical protein
MDQHYKCYVCNLGIRSDTRWMVFASRTGSRDTCTTAIYACAAEKAAIERLGVRVINASRGGWGIINHDLFLSNAEVQRVIRRSIDTAAANSAGGNDYAGRMPARRDVLDD